MKLNQTQKLLLGVVAGMMVLVLVLSLFLFQTGTGHIGITAFHKDLAGLLVVSGLDDALQTLPGQQAVLHGTDAGGDG